MISALLVGGSLTPELRLISLIVIWISVKHSHTVDATTGKGQASLVTFFMVVWIQRVRRNLLEMQQIALISRGP